MARTVMACEVTNLVTLSMFYLSADYNFTINTSFDDFLTTIKLKNP